MGDKEISNSEDVREYAEKNDLVGIKEYYEKKLEEWKDVEITIAVTGNSGVGKSSLINAIKGNRIAKTGPTETTTEPEEYTYSAENQNIKLWDLPGIGTPKCPDLETYCKKVNLEKYDTFLICTAGSFTNNDLQIAKKVKSMEKPFLFVRTKIDQDIDNAYYDNDQNEESTLKKIREDLWENLSELETSKKNVFLISNRRKDKYDFSGLINAILNDLPLAQKETLILSLPSDLKDTIKRKVEVLRGRIWKAASASAAVAAVPAPGLSLVFDSALLMKEINFYKSQLGIPDQSSKEFQGMTPEMKSTILKYCVTAVQLGHLVAAYAASSTAEEFARFIPFVGGFIAGGISFGSTYWFLDKCLKEFETTALNLLDETTSIFLKELDSN